MSENSINKRKRERKEQKQTQKGRRLATACTLGVHSLLFLIFFSSSVTPPPPPPAPKLLVELLPDTEIKPIMASAGNEPRAEKATPTEEIRLVQKSQGVKVSEKITKNSSESELGNEGDVEKYEPPKPVINKKALFSAPKHKKDSLAEQTSAKISNALAAGHPEGNTIVGETEGAPLAKLKGRNVEGSLPFPAYTVNKGGKVVVKIRVDQYGTVINAIPGVSGTTVQDKKLWDAAAKAATQAKFNVSSTAEMVQEGTITYTFILK